MHDLRRQALESKKTVSRKARSRIASGANSKTNSALNSPAQSRATSRNRSRYGSDDAFDDDDEYFSDNTVESTNTLDDIINNDDVDAVEEAWKTELRNRIERIVDRKGSSTEERTGNFDAYAYILRARFAKDEIVSRQSELVPAILRSIKSETTESETVSALKALSVMVVTLDSDDVYDHAAGVLRRAIQSSQSVQTKASAVHALGTAAFFGGTSEEELEDLMAFFLEIVESDGLAVDAHDEASVVIAALEEWSLLATALDDIEDATEAAIEAFVDQLDSADVGVQTAAGEAIALLYEKSYTPIEDDEEPESDDDEPVNAWNRADKMVKRYTVYRRQDQLIHTLESLATESSRRVSRKDRRALHTNFTDIRNSVEHPTRGPKYSTAINDETGQVYGSGRMRIVVGSRVVVKIDKWWKLQRANALRRVLQLGLKRHYAENEVVSRTLPFSMLDPRA